MNHFDRELKSGGLAGRHFNGKVESGADFAGGGGFPPARGERQRGVGRFRSACGRPALALRLEVEPLGYLESNAAAASLQAAVAFLELLLRATAHFRMVTDLHAEAVAADYEALPTRTPPRCKASQAPDYKALAAIWKSGACAENRSR